MGGFMKLEPHTRGAVASALPVNFKDGLPPGLEFMGVRAMWKAGHKGTGVKVGVIDTGIDDGHPDLRTVLLRRDYVQDGAQRHEFDPHGTHVAGTIAACGDLLGAAPDATLLDYRVLDKQGRGTYENVAQAARDAADDGCNVINMSLGGPDDIQAVREAIEYATTKALVVCAVGNNGPNAKSYPGYYRQVVGSGAVLIIFDKSGPYPYGTMARSYFSNTNDEVDVCAHGEDVVSCAPGGGYQVMSGTSMASPAVSGFAALKVQCYKEALGVYPLEQAVWEAVKSSAVKIADGNREHYGAGFACAFPSLPKLRTLKLTPGVAEIVVDGVAKPIDATPTVANGRTYTPTRHTHEAMGDGVGYNANTKEVTIERLFVPGVEI